MWIALLILAITASIAAVVWPLLNGERSWQLPNAETRLDELLAEKTRVLRLLKDIDAERDAGLMADADHDETRREYLGKAIALNREIASLTGVDPSADVGEVFA